MVRRIFRNIVLTAILAVLLTAALIVPAMYGAYEEQISRQLRQEAESIARGFDMTDASLTYLQSIRSDNRITLIASDGTVLYDSITDAASMENHADRPEVAQALAEGSGASTRLSDTLSETILYSAWLTADGSVLRIASARSSVLGAFMNVLPLVSGALLCAVALSFWIARRAARRIVAPINALNLDDPLENDAYDELAPLLTRIQRQHAQIRQHLCALENARTELTAIIENMREGMILLDMKGEVLSMNESAARIFGVDSADHTGQSILSVYRDSEIHDLVQCALRGDSRDLLMRRGSKTYQIYASPVLQEAAVRGAVLLILDVTERFAAEASRREFTTNVSHELKTPLTSISGFAEIIRDGIAQPQDVPNFASRICDEAQRLIALVNDILELSRLDEKQSPGKKESVALQPMLRGLVDDFAPLAQKKQLSLTLRAADVRIDAYPALLREMFFNLVDNAVKYTPEGGSIAVTVTDANGCVECAVSDNGVGIPLEHQPHVFERFYRVDKSHSRASGGTGLGLAIVKHAAELHRAQLTLTSKKGNGTTVTLRFPK